MTPSTSPAVSSHRTQKLDRMAHANAVLKAISSHGRRFFYHAKDDRVAEFELDGRGALWFIDEYRAARVYIAYQGRWRGFSGGGTMRSLIEALAGYIREGRPIPAGHFGPWSPELVGQGDLWGYGFPAMTVLRQELAGNPAIRAPQGSPASVTA